VKPFALSSDYSIELEENPPDDSRKSDLARAMSWAELLSGDVVLLPSNACSSDVPNIEPGSLIPFAGHWSELEPSDVARLAILTAGFGRWIDAADDVAILTLVQGGTPSVLQVGGATNYMATALAQEALVEHRPIADVGLCYAPPKPANDNQPQFVDPSGWAGRPVPSRSWFIEGLVPGRTVTLLSGDGGVGKSLLALQLGLASALGVETLGLEPAPGRVLYVGAEDEVAEFHRRTADILRGLGGTFAGLRNRLLLMPLAERDAVLALPDKAGTMVPTPLLTTLIEKVATWRPGLIVLDTLADLFGGDEIKRSQARQFIAMLRAIAIGCDCAVLLLAHPSVSGMQSGSGTSGSTAWNNSVRSRLYLTAKGGEDADPDARLLTTKKANYGATGEAIALRWESGTFVLDDGKPSAAAGILNKRHDDAFLRLLSAVNRSGQRVAPTKGVNYAPAILAKRPDAGGATKKQLESAMGRLIAAGEIKVVVEGSPSRQRQRLILSSEDFSGAA